MVKQARILAGLSQRQLAERLGTTQPVIARWERGNSAPSFDRVAEAVRVSGFELAVKVLTPDVEHESQIEELPALTPAQRLLRFEQRQAHQTDSLLGSKGKDDAEQASSASAH